VVVSKSFSVVACAQWRSYAEIVRIREAGLVLALSILASAPGCSLFQRRDASPPVSQTEPEAKPAPSERMSGTTPKDFSLAFKAERDVTVAPTTERARFFRSPSEASVGLQWAGTPPELRAMKDYPTAERPHRMLGKITIVEKRSNPNREKIDWDTPALTEKRTRALEAEAARVGANALILEREDAYYEVNRSVRTASYYAVSLSSAVAEKPSVDTLLSRMALEKDGFKVAKRFTTNLEELGTRAPETVQVKRGHATLIVLALHPEAEPEARFDLRLKVDGKEDTKSIDYRAGAGLAGFHGNPLDGISRAAGGWITHAAFRTESAKVWFGPRARSSKTIAPGRGPVEVVVFERALSDSELLSAACSWCKPAAGRCSRRRPLEQCAELTACFNRIQVPLAKCAASYE
jgi:hypothetical protein